jgi:hypothetical protein
MDKVLLRIKDLRRYGVNNWMTLARWIANEGAPAGFYLGPNTRCWYKEDWDTWLANRPSAAPPENASAANSCSTRSDGGTIDTSAGRQSNPRDRRIGSIPQAFPNRRAAR